jgi:hypothetical protein
MIGSAPSPSSNYPVVDSSGAPLISTQEKAELFVHTLSAHTSTPPSCAGAANKEKFFTSKADAAISSEVPNPLNSKIILSELSSGLQNLKSRALGPDLIHNEMLKQLSPVNRRSLLHLFNLFSYPASVQIIGKLLLLSLSLNQVSLQMTSIRTVRSPSRRVWLKFLNAL